MSTKWPEFNEQGDLPRGVYPARLNDVLQHFGTCSLQRQIVARRLAHIYALATKTGLVWRFVVFGSFVTAKREPRDVDIFLLMQDSFELQLVKDDSAAVFDHQAADSQLGASIFWIRRAAAIGGEEQAIEFWQTKRDGSVRGIIEVVK